MRFWDSHHIKRNFRLAENRPTPARCYILILGAKSFCDVIGMQGDVTVSHCDGSGQFNCEPNETVSEAPVLKTMQVGRVTEEVLV